MDHTLAPAEDAALQHKRGTMVTETLRAAVPEGRGAEAFRKAPHRMTQPAPREYLIQGLTLDGKTFRPSDWAERLAGAMSCFRPEGSVGGRAAFIGYSPYCVPRTIDSVRCVIVNEALRGLEPMAWDFVMNFARDNKLKVVDASALPESPAA